MRFFRAFCFSTVVGLFIGFNSYGADHLLGALPLCPAPSSLGSIVSGNLNQSIVSFDSLGQTWEVDYIDPPDVAWGVQSGESLPEISIFMQDDRWLFASLEDEISAIWAYNCYYFAQSGSQNPHEGWEFSLTLYTRSILN